jgi:3-dehydroquinate dehydratase-1
MFSTQSLVTRPHLVGTVSTLEGLAFLQSPDRPADLIEVRLDCLRSQGVELEQVREALARRQHPVLLTPRIPAEGGTWDWKPSERLSWTVELLHEADVLDIEMQSLKSMQHAVEMVVSTGKRLILSAHSIEQPATAAQFQYWAEVASAYKPFCAKIASRVETTRHMQDLALFLLERRPAPWAVMGVGPQAHLSRQVLSALGSRLAYGYLDVPAAPGQPSVAELRNLLPSLT